MSATHLLHLPVTVTVILILVYFSEMYGDDGSTSRHRRQDENLSMEEDEEYEEDLSSAVSDTSEEDGHILWAEHDGNSPQPQDAYTSW